MINRFQNRRQFLTLMKLSLAFLVSSCSKNPNKLTIGIQEKFYPDSFIRFLPKSWIRRNINFSNMDFNKNYENSELLIVNDGWIDNLNFDDFKNIKNNSMNKLDTRALTFLNNISQNKRSKLMPIGVIPYVVVLKNNKDLKISADQQWDFLLAESLKNKIILPDSPRVVISIARRMSTERSLKKLISQAFAFDDKNALNWLINSDINAAIVPYSFCYDSLKIDSRLSFLFPNDGVPLIWNFLLTKSNLNGEKIDDWINSLDEEFVCKKLRSEGFFLPFEFGSSKNEYGQDTLISKFNNLPSKECWANSWSFGSLSINQKKELEKLWASSLTP